MTKLKKTAIDEMQNELHAVSLSVAISDYAEQVIRHMEQNRLFSDEVNILRSGKTKPSNNEKQLYV